MKIPPPYPGRKAGGNIVPPNVVRVLHRYQEAGSFKGRSGSYQFTPSLTESIPFRFVQYYFPNNDNYNGVNLTWKNIEKIRAEKRIQVSPDSIIELGIKHVLALLKPQGEMLGAVLVNREQLRPEVMDVLRTAAEGSQLDVDSYPLIVFLPHLTINGHLSFGFDFTSIGATKEVIDALLGGLREEIAELLSSHKCLFVNAYCLTTPLK